MPHVLPPLPYGQAALEPHIDTRTMMLHHDKHHASYVTNLNAALEKSPELGERSALWLLLNLDKVPKVVRVAVRNNAGGHLNHSMFWRVMSPAGGGAPSGQLADAINRDFGSFERFRNLFNEAGAKMFGSGWVWLARDPDDGGKLQVYTMSGHDNPVMQGHIPLLVNDVWEHAYYLKHENRRPDYLRGWWATVHWEEVARRFELSEHTQLEDWEDDCSLLRVPVE